MAKISYQQTMSKIKTSNEFKENLILKMQNADKTSFPITIKQKHFYRKITPIAACFICIISVIAILCINEYHSTNTANIANTGNDNKENKTSYDYIQPYERSMETYPDNLEVSENLPELSISTESGGMGFEGYTAHNIDELVGNNPWTKDYPVSVLPIYKNNSHVIVEEARVDGKPLLSEDQMAGVAKSTADKLNVNITNMTSSSETKSPITKAAFNNGVISVKPTGEINIEFYDDITLPDEYSFTIDNTTRDQANEVLDYFIDKYSSLINMKSPTKNISGDYWNDGKLHLDYTIYESNGSLVDKVLGYNFNTITFVPSPLGALAEIKINQTDLSTKIGNYPIITSDEAKALLLAGHYATTTGWDVPTEDSIADVQLIYRNSIYDAFLMPYYKFLVEVENPNLTNGLKSYSAFYVPAVEGKYIENMSLWNGEFN